MTFLPIVGRELRVAARQRAVFWSRLGFALVAILISSFFMMTTLRNPASQISVPLFTALSILAYIYCLFAGIWITSDCLSEEKREGTLGLLFLTNLRGYDVILGKLTATSVRAFYGLFAIFPVMAIPLLMGGLNIGEFWRMALVLTNTLLLSLTTGVFISAVSKHALRASFGTFVVLLLLVAAGPLTAWIVAVVVGFNTVEFKEVEFLFIHSSAYSIALVYDQMFSNQRYATFFWWSVGINHGLIWLALIGASLLVRRAWQDRPAMATRWGWRDRWRKFKWGPAKQRQRRRTLLLGINPIYWCTGRERLKPTLVWVALGVAALIWVWLAVRFHHDFFEEGTYIITAFFLHSMIKIWIASEAARRFSDDRRSGVLELILCTPMKISDVLKGHMMSLKWQFLWPIAMILLLDVAFMLEPAIKDHRVYSTMRPHMWLFLVGMTVFVIDAYALAWLGMWASLNNRHVSRAAGSTVFRVLMVPWLIFILLLILMAFLDMMYRIRIDNKITESGMLGLWFFLGLANSLFLLAWGHRKLNAELRTLAATRTGFKVSRKEKRRQAAMRADVDLSPSKATEVG